MSELVERIKKELGGEWVDTKAGATCDGIEIVRYGNNDYEATRGEVTAKNDSPYLAVSALRREEKRLGV